MKYLLLVLLFTCHAYSGKTGADTLLVKKQAKLYYAADTTCLMYIDSSDSILKPTAIKYNKSTGKMSGGSSTVVSQGAGITVLRSSDTFTVSLYQPPLISSLTNTAASNYAGQTVTGLTVNWSLSGSAITAQTLTDIGSLNIADRSHIFTGLSLTTDKYYTLAITDGVTPTSSNTWVYFYIAKFRGTTTNTSVTEADLEAGTTTWVLQSSANRDLASTAMVGAGKYLFYAYPLSWGTVQINVNGFASTWVDDTVSVTNAYSDVRDYKVYRSPFVLYESVNLTAVGN